MVSHTDIDVDQPPTFTNPYQPNQKDQTMNNDRTAGRPQIPLNWTIETTARNFEAWAKPDGCRAIVLQIPEATDAVTVKVFTGETAYMDAARHAEDLALAQFVCDCPVCP